MADTPAPAATPAQPANRTPNRRRREGGWFGPLVAIILLAGAVGGGLIAFNHFLGGEPAFSHHSEPPTVTAVKTVNHADHGEIGIVEKDGQPLLSEAAPAVEIAGDWAGAQWIKVSNDRDKLGFRLWRPVPGKEGEKFFPKNFWALKRS